MGILSLAACFSPGCFMSGKENDASQYAFFNVAKDGTHDTLSTLPWESFKVGKDPILLGLKGKIRKGEESAAFRITTATHFHGQEKHLVLELPSSREVIGMLDMKHCPAMQITEISIEPKYLKAISKQGVFLRLTDSNSPADFIGNHKLSEGKLLLPHLFLPGSQQIDNEGAFLETFFSINSIQQFGWMEGAVLDGLWQIYERKNDQRALVTLKDHLRFYIGEGNESNYRLNSIESTLPLAIIARTYPNHPILGEAESFWQSHLKEHGGIVDYSITAEGAYTISYPMAVMSNVLKGHDLADMAIKQLEIRKKLIYEDDCYLRYYPQDGHRTYKNWARGITWYMLGIIRTIEELKDKYDLDSLEQEFIRISNWVVQFQNENGLWSCFIDNNSIVPDTSGSAGIAAALATGVRLNILDSSFKVYAERTWGALLDSLTQDGLLKGVAQSNSGGEELQRSDYRVIFQMGMGLMGQLYAELNKT